MRAVASIIGGAVLLSAHMVWAADVAVTEVEINKQLEAFLNTSEIEPLGDVVASKPAVGLSLKDIPLVQEFDTPDLGEVSPFEASLAPAVDPQAADMPTEVAASPLEEVIQEDGIESVAASSADNAALVPESKTPEPKELRVKASDGMRNSLAALRQRTLENPIPYPQPIALAARSSHAPIVKGGSFLPPSEYRDIARKVAQMHAVPEELFFKLVKAESNWNQSAISRVGALGLAQLMPGTAKYLGVDPLDPFQNLEGGARYLSEQFRKFGTWDLALAAYNAGPGAVEQYGGIPPYAETQAYVQKILNQ